MSDLQAQVPDHIAITGDLVNLALEAEFAPAKAWLETVGSPEKVTLVPGNHDAYVRATGHRFAEAWTDYLVGDDVQGAGAIFPSLRRRGPLALIGVSTAVPTPPPMATGWLGKSQMEALGRLLAGLASESAFRVLLIHPPAPLQRARQASDRCAGTPGASQAARR